MTSPVISMSLTQDVLQYLCRVHRAAFRWIISKHLMSTTLLGLHTELAYSSIGLTNAFYARSFTKDAPIFRVFLSKLRVLLALLVMLMWVSQVASEASVMPRYRVLFTALRVWPWRVY